MTGSRQRWWAMHPLGWVCTFFLGLPICISFHLVLDEQIGRGRADVLWVLCTLTAGLIQVAAHPRDTVGSR